MNQKVIIINDIIIELDISKLSIEIDYVGGGGEGGLSCRKFYIPQNYIQVAFLCIKNIVPIKSCATFKSSKIDTSPRLFISITLITKIGHMKIASRIVPASI